MQDDTLLTRYLQDGSEAAFSQLVTRHLPLVYRACLRETGSAAQAEDAAQVVFLLLARKAKSLQDRSSLTGWLYQTAVFVAKNVHKQEARRKLREHIVMQEAVDAEAVLSPNWNTVEPLLNSALLALKSADREAVLLRFLEGHTLAETGTLLGLTEDIYRIASVCACLDVHLLSTSERCNGSRNLESWRYNYFCRRRKTCLENSLSVHY